MASKNGWSTATMEKAWVKSDWDVTRDPMPDSDQWEPVCTQTAKKVAANLNSVHLNAGNKILAAFKYQRFTTDEEAAVGITKYVHTARTAVEKRPPCIFRTSMSYGATVTMHGVPNMTEAHRPRDQFFTIKAASATGSEVFSKSYPGTEDLCVASLRADVYKELLDANKITEATKVLILLDAQLPRGNTKIWRGRLGPNRQFATSIVSLYAGPPVPEAGPPAPEAGPSAPADPTLVDRNVRQRTD